MSVADESIAVQSPPQLVEAVRLLGIYTAGRFDAWLLAGPAKASCRAHVMSALAGQRMPQSKSGVVAIRAELYRQSAIAGCDFSGCDCEALRERAFMAFCRQGGAR